MSEYNIKTIYPHLDSVCFDSSTLNLIRAKHPELPEEIESNIVLAISDPDQVYEGNHPNTNVL